MVDEELKEYPSAIRLLESVRDEVRKRPESLAAPARAYYHTGRQEMARKTLRGERRRLDGSRRNYFSDRCGRKLL